jgi:hypothetical protein
VARYVAERAGRAWCERPVLGIRKARKVGWIIALGSVRIASADASVSAKA